MTDQPASRPAGAALPVLTVSDVSTAAFEVVLLFMYTGEVQALSPAFLEPQAAAELFDAADRLLQFPMKVTRNLVVVIDMPACCAHAPAKNVTDPEEFSQCRLRLVLRILESD